MGLNCLWKMWLHDDLMILYLIAKYICIKASGSILTYWLVTPTVLRPLPCSAEPNMQPNIHTLNVPLVVKDFHN